MPWWCRHPPQGALWPTSVTPCALYNIHWCCWTSVVYMIIARMSVWFYVCLEWFEVHIHADYLGKCSSKTSFCYGCKLWKPRTLSGGRKHADRFRSCRQFCIHHNWGSSHCFRLLFLSSDILSSKATRGGPTHSTSIVPAMLLIYTLQLWRQKNLDNFWVPRHKTVHFPHCVL